MRTRPCSLVCCLLAVLLQAFLVGCECCGSHANSLLGLSLGATCPALLAVLRTSSLISELQGLPPCIPDSPDNDKDFYSSSLLLFFFVFLGMEPRVLSMLSRLSC